MYGQAEMWVERHALIASPQEVSRPVLVISGSGSGSWASGILYPLLRTPPWSMVVFSPSQEQLLFGL